MAVAPNAARAGCLGLEARIEHARDVALDRLLALRTHDGVWRQRFDLNTMTGATYIVMLRTTGLIDQPRSRRDEAMVAQHIVHQSNLDGGFPAFPGEPSSVSVTRLASDALRAVLGMVPPGARPPEWFAANPEVDASLARRCERAIDDAMMWLRSQSGSAMRRREPEFELPQGVFSSLLGFSKGSAPWFPLGLGGMLLAVSWPPLVRLHRNVSALVRQILPGFVLLHHATRQCGCARRHGHRTARRERIAKGLVEWILARQNRMGDWFYCVPYTLTNMMALSEAGLPASHPAIARAHGFVRDSLFETPDGGLGVSVMNSDIWDTSVAVAAYLAAPGRTAMDHGIRSAIEFLLDNQGPHGGYGWGAGAVHDPDCDSTAAVLRVLFEAHRTADAGLSQRIRRAIDSGTAHVTYYQNRQGSFGVWARSLARGRPGPVGPMRGLLADVPSADLTGRVVGALAVAGQGSDAPVVRRAIRAITGLQSANGGWWCRWWAGYVSGTSFVLDGLGQIGLRYGTNVHSGDRLQHRAARALGRGVDFLLAHQNPDGGWGESIAADWDPEQAGVGRSRPLQTAAALLGLAAVGYPMSSRTATRAVSFLLDAQSGEGRWCDDQATFTILPRRCYYRHPLYTASIVPLALSVFLKARRA